MGEPLVSPTERSSRGARRRKSGSAHFSGALALLLPAVLAAPAPGAETRRPNILVILADDLGWGDLGCYGASDLRTPHLDRLAERGMRFDRFYANCPVCSPTRAALLTGRYPEMVGVPGVIRTHAENNWGHLRPDAVLLPQLLARAGYHTALIGKWHLGLEEPNRPNDRGFHLFRGFLGDMMDDYFTHRRHGINYMRHNDEEIDPEGHASELFTRWAEEYLRERAAAEGPFFLYLAYNAPHTPIQPPEEWLERVRKREEGINPKRARLAALIEHLDDCAGRVLRVLEETGLAEETVAIFTSDNGGQLSAGARNGPLRDGKGSVYEGGIRVPMFAAWPGRIAPGSRSLRLALSMDICATALDLAGVAVPPDLDGASFLPELLGRERTGSAREVFFARREGGLGFGGKTIEAVRRGEWKLLQRSPYAPLELYNLEEDPEERVDLAAGRPEVLRDLAQSLRRQIQRYGSVPWQRPEARVPIEREPSRR